MTVELQYKLPSGFPNLGVFLAPKKPKVIVASLQQFPGKLKVTTYSILQNEDMTPPQKKQISPLSMRLTAEERTQLEKDSSGMSFGAYIRSRLFESGAIEMRT